MIHLVLADDHTLFRQGLAELFREADGFELLAQAADGNALLQAIGETQPDVALVDVSMPGPPIEQLPQTLRQRGLATRVMALTLHSEPLVARRVIKAGVAGYLLKTSDFEDVLAAIRIVAGGGQFVSPALAGALLMADGAAAPAALTPREREVLRWIAAGLSNKQIAARLSLSIHTVDTHRTNLMRKLDLHSTAELVRYACANGLADS